MYFSITLLLLAVLVMMIGVFCLVFSFDSHLRKSARRQLRLMALLFLLLFGIFFWLIITYPMIPGF